MNLHTLGFTAFFQQQLTDELPTDTTIGRVVIEHKHSYRVQTEKGELLATVSGNFAFNAFSRTDYPAVGDFVYVKHMQNEQRGVITKLFERRSKFVRKMAGHIVDEQIVAANVDYVLLVMSLNEDFNIRRLERYIVASWDSGATPVVVLTKADLCEDVDMYKRQVESVAFGVDLFIVSAYENKGIDALQKLLTTGKTAALLGSSGAGKSTLTNVLLQEDFMKVQQIRDDDAKGRHTTTHRELVILPSGACLIDTPGMRELQLWDQSNSLQTGFQDIDALSTQCQFRDCSHVNEPGCSVNEAIATGQLDAERLQSYFKLQKELAYIERKTDQAAKLQEKRKWKKISKTLKKQR